MICWIGSNIHGVCGECLLTGGRWEIVMGLWKILEILEDLNINILDLLDLLDILDIFGAW